MRRIGLAAALLFGVCPPVAGQLLGASDGPELDYWYSVFYPKLFYAGKEGFLAGAYFAMVQPLRSRDFDSPPPYRVSVSVNGQASTSGSRFLQFDARAPGLNEHWRLTGRLSTQRQAKDDYFGIGNTTVFDSDSVTDARPNFYRAVRTQYTARGEIQRTLVGGLRLLAGFNVERWKLASARGASVFTSDSSQGLHPRLGVPTDEVVGRVGIVWDTRDDEVAPGRGLLIEAIWGVADSTVAGDLSYTRTTLSARGFLTTSPRLQLAARVVAQTMGGTPRVGSLYLIEGSDRSFEGIGGSATHRAVRPNRLLGRDKLFGNVEARYVLFGIPTLYRISVLAFLDAGRVFDPIDGEDFTLTTDAMKVGGGTGLFFQIGRAGVAGYTIGVGPDGISTYVHTRWTF